MSHRPDGPLYSRDFPQGEKPRRYMLDAIPRGWWRHVRAKAKRDDISMRALILRLLDMWFTGKIQLEGADAKAGTGK